MNIRETILNAPMAKEAVIVPEWGVTVWVKAMNTSERIDWADQAYDDDGNYIEANHRSVLLAHCLVDENEKRIFTNDDAKDLDKKHGVIVTKLYAMAIRFNTPLTAEDAEKNSLSGASGT